MVLATVAVPSSGTVTSAAFTHSSQGYAIELRGGGSSVLNYSSPILTISGQVWNGAVSVTDSWTMQDILTNALNGASALTFAHTGSTGFASVQVPSLNNQGGNIVKVNTQTGASYTPLVTDYVVLFTYAGAVAVTLNSSLATGTAFKIKNKTGVGNSVTLTPSSGTIDGSATFVMSTNYQSVDVVFDGTNWNTF